MILKNIEWRNFKSYSNIPTVINFEDTSSVNLIVGENGTGKSSVEEVIKYTLYGKLDNFNNSDIPNRINKNFYSKIEVDCDGHDVIIERGLSPNIFAVTIDGEKVDTAGKTNVQNMLEEIYFKMPYSVFNNTLVLSINTFKSLVDLNASDKRSIIDKIFGFDMYNQYIKKAKEEYKQVSSNISKNEGSISYSNSVKLDYERQIEEIKKNEVSQEEIDELESKLKELDTIYQKKMNMLNKLMELKNEFEKKKQSYKNQFTQYKLQINEIDKKINLIDSGRCPTCGNNLTTDEFTQEREKLIEEKNEIVKQQSKLQELAQSAISKLNAISEKTNSIKKEINQSKITDLKSDLKYKTTMKDKSVEPLEFLKEELDRGIKQLNEEYRELTSEKEILDTILLIFGENGIRKHTLSKNIPIINNMLLQTLESMGLNYVVEFDDNFNNKITQNGYPIKYSTLSTGEKAKIDFSCIVTIIKFLKLQHGDLNLLFLDELFSNIDINGVSFMIDILKDLASELHMNVFLIHHAPLEGIVFDKVYRTSKPDGFSRLDLI